MQQWFVGAAAVVKEGRVMFQCILTYTLNSVTKKIVQVLSSRLPAAGRAGRVNSPWFSLRSAKTGSLLRMQT
jgi:H+-transporting ATPase